ncbi:uncharacterized protein LOC123527651 [Mercenaria mercenaria]|uniref:uncharacterized protein LOC123527651 n=1 Tax=Mercenaria mercenaria TaxID=6596 RepID=UPI00234F016D|nr:uncharacterized protein LOC123527651 [Mercenaria mercenaria]
MKPTQTNQKATSPAVILQTEARGKTLTRKMIYMLIGAFAFVLVVSAVILAVYFGMQMTKDNFKEYTATFSGDDGTSTKEKVIVTDTEEIFETAVATGISDFSMGLVTYKFQKTGIALDVNVCYVTNLNTSDFQTPEEFIETHTSDQITFARNNQVLRKYEVTDIWLNNKALGPKSKELCKGKPVFFLREITETRTREKRAKWKVTINLGIVKVEISWGKERKEK